MYVWQTTADASFVELPEIEVGIDGSFEVTVGADSIVTISTESSARHGSFDLPVPNPVPFPIPYADSFDEYAFDAMAKYFSDQGGSWSVRNGSLTQVNISLEGY